MGQGAVSAELYVYDSLNKLPLPPIIVINKRLGTGEYKSVNRFTVTGLDSDTLLISVSGYTIKELSMEAIKSMDLEVVPVALQKMVITLQRVEIYPMRTLVEIQEDINRLDMDIPKYSVTGIDVAFSPITYLYERFSKFGKSRSRVAQWKSEDVQRAILKDLFKLYIEYDIIQLDDKEFEEFVDYLNFSNEFIRKSSQLELVTAVKGKYESFKYRWK